MAIIYVFQPDGTMITRKATKDDDEKFYRSYSQGVEKGHLTILRQPNKKDYNEVS